MDFNSRKMSSQRGQGLGGMFHKFFKWIVPLVKTHALPIVESSAKAVGEELVESSADVVTDVIHGQNLQESTQNRFGNAVTNLKRRAEQSLKGSGIKKKKPGSTIKGLGNLKNVIIIKKRTNSKSRTLDIFD